MPATEAEKILPRILCYLEGKTVLDLGCGVQKVVHWATGIDDSSESKHLQPGTISAKIDPSSRQISPHLVFDVVFSSHALEHIRDPIKEILAYWLQFLKKEGLLILYLPDERRYVYDRANVMVRNPGHVHYLIPETFRWYLQQLPVTILAVEEDEYIPDRYSFLVIARKK